MSNEGEGGSPWRPAGRIGRFNTWPWSYLSRNWQQYLTPS